MVKFGAPLLMVLGLLLGACVPIRPLPAATAVPAAASTHAAGIYKGFFPGASSPGLDATLYLNSDGTLRLESDYLNEAPPTVETGSWLGSGEAITVTLSNQAGQVAAEPVTKTLTLAGDRLVAAAWIGPWFRFDALAQGMAPPYDAALATQMMADKNFLGYYKNFAPAADCCGLDRTLLLGIDKQARLKTDYLNGEPPIVETGDWQVNDDGTITVRLVGREDGVVYEAPATLVLAAEDGLLQTVEYDPALFGEATPHFYLFPALALANVNR